MVDAEVEARIEARSRAVADRMKRPYTDFAFGVRKQATLPEGAIVAGVAGTAPALVLEVDGCVAVTLPGPPASFRSSGRRCWRPRRCGGCSPPTQPRERRALRFYGVGESTVAQALAAAGGDGDGVEVTICARDSEIHLDLFVAPGAEARADALEAALVEPVAPFLFSRTEEPIEALVLEACRARGLTLATAESCTGGLVAGAPDGDRRLERRVPRLSRLVLERGQGGGARCARGHARGPWGSIGGDRLGHGPWCPRAPRRRRRGSVTGIAGPGGGTPEKPVGLVYLCASGPGGELARDFRSRATARRCAAAPRSERCISCIDSSQRCDTNRHRHVTISALAWPAWTRPPLPPQPARHSLPRDGERVSVRCLCFHFPAASGWGAVRRTRSGSAGAALGG